MTPFSTVILQRPYFRLASWGICNNPVLDVGKSHTIDQVRSVAASLLVTYLLFG